VGGFDINNKKEQWGEGMTRNNPAGQFHTEFDERLSAMENWLKGRTSDTLILYMVAMLRLEISCRISGASPDEVQIQSNADKLRRQ
jgi:hypothetical protein